MPKRVVISSLISGVCALGAALATAAAQAAAPEPYIAGIETVPATADAPAEAAGIVFHDRNRNGRRDQGEPGVRGVRVSNGIEVVRTGRGGTYTLPVRDDMAVFVIQPAGWRVPTDENWTPQFAYQHKPQGSPKKLRFGGLPATGPLPAAINFPLLREEKREDFTCAILGDTQTYANAEISHTRDSVVDDLLDLGPGAVDCILAVGDVLGDDLGLLPRLADVLGTIGAPQWWTHGNHDFDFDADHDRNSADSWRRLWGPAYYAFEMGEVLFIVLDNVVYPCTAEDAQKAGREYCVTEDRKRYNGRITDDQMTFVRNLLALTDPAKTVVVSTHIPLVSFVDNTSPTHQTDNVAELYALLDGRKALSLSGHTHTIENLAPGDSFAGWQPVLGFEEIPFRHIIAGAVSGSWNLGDFDIHGTPMALQRLGGPRGWLKLDFRGGDYVETYLGANQDRKRAMWLSVNTPGFRNWFETIMAWRAEPEEERDPVPPLSINDLPDVKLLTPEDLAGGSYITANVWAGSSDTKVTVAINDGEATAMDRTQEAEGEEARIGADYADPFAAQRQLSVMRVALQSRSGVERAQGAEAFQGRRAEPSPPGPYGPVADRSMHLWRFKLPEGLPEGAHVATVRVTDRHGRVFTDRLAFEVRAQRPPKYWRADVWDRFENGPPVR